MQIKERNQTLTRRTLMQNKTIPAVILVIGMIVSSIILSKFFLKIRHEKNITVKGFAQTEVKSDIGKLRFSIDQKAKTLKAAYQGINRDKQKLYDFLANKNLSTGAIEELNLYTREIKKINSKGQYTNDVTAYNATQNFMITSKDVGKIEALAKDLNALIESDVNIRVNTPQYYISDLQELKIKLLSRATEDGFARAKKLASGSGAKVGALVSGTQGVFQITEPNSMKVSSYGLYNTNSIMKSVKAVVTLSYAVK